MEIAGGNTVQVERPARAKALRWDCAVVFEEGGGQGGQHGGGESSSER